MMDNNEKKKKKKSFPNILRKKKISGSCWQIGPICLGKTNDAFSHPTMGVVCSYLSRRSMAKINKAGAHKK